MRLLLALATLAATAFAADDYKPGPDAEPRDNVPHGEVKAMAACGMSSGGIAAFTVAWERPERFHKVVSHIGSFTNIRGGYIYPAQIRQTQKQPKPLRVFLQDGANDLDNLHGNWPLSNQDMAA